MILPWPLTTSSEIAHVLRPGGHLRADSALRILRESELPAEPISVVPRSARGAHGRIVWYSSLMLDVARLVRTDEIGAARALHAAANKLASHRSARFVAESLASAGGEPDASDLDLETGGALTRLAVLTSSAREKHRTKLGIESFVGRVADVAGRVAFVVDDDGRTLPIPTSSDTPNPWAASLVAVDTEVLSGGATTIWIRPAFDSEADSNQRVPAAPHLLTASERERLPQSVATIR
jgi:hypothetical protein